MKSKFKEEQNWKGRDLTIIETINPKTKVSRLVVFRGQWSDDQIGKWYDQHPWQLFEPSTLKI